MSSKKDDRIKELEAAIIEKDVMNAKHLEVNKSLAEKIVNIEGQLKQYEKIFAKKDKQVDKQFDFIQEYREGLIRLGNIYKEDGQADNSDAVTSLIVSIDGLKKVFDELKVSDKEVLEVVKGV